MFLVLETLCWLLSGYVCCYVLLHKVANCYLHFPFLITKYVALKLNLEFKGIKFDILLDASLRQLKSWRVCIMWLFGVVFPITAWCFVSWCCLYGPWNIHTHSSNKSSALILTLYQHQIWTLLLQLMLGNFVSWCCLYGPWNIHIHSSNKSSSLILTLYQRRIWTLLLQLILGSFVS
jgi:hypothetical protein